jgi:hypothetical protein
LADEPDFKGSEWRDSIVENTVNGAAGGVVGTWLLGGSDLGASVAVGAGFGLVWGAVSYPTKVAYRRWKRGT